LVWDVEIGIGNGPPPRRRRTETEASIKLRLQTARRELQQAEKYQFHVTNDDLDKAVREIAQILSSRETE
jgi:guanylate kinase